MNDRTLVKAYANEYGIDFRTVSRAWKSPHRFYVLRDELARPEQEPRIVTHDIYSFAVLRRDSRRGLLTMEITWLSGSESALTGRVEKVAVPYDRLMDFVEASAQEGGPETWRALSVDTSGRKPRFVFNRGKTLRAVLNNAPVRRRLFRCLETHFNWPNSDRICFYGDFPRYSFFFEETTNGRSGICGGVILHGQENMEKAYYSVHT